MLAERCTRREWLLASGATLVGSSKMAHGQDSAKIPVTGQAGPGLKRFDGVLLAMLKKHQFPGASLAIAKAGRLVLARGYGFADLKTQQAVRPRMLFGVGSVGKLLTAAAILKLVDQQKLRLDDRAFGLLKDLKPPDGAKLDPRVRAITVRMLLNHTSGFDLSSHPAEAAKAFKVPKDEVTPDQLVRFRLGKPLTYPPGAEWHYSNFGYVVLGQIVAHVSGQLYQDFVRKEILTPLGIQRADYGTRSATYPRDWVHRYDKQGVEMEPLRPVAAGAAGIWVMASVDVVRFLTALDGAAGTRFFPPALLKEMLSAPPPPVKPRKDGVHRGLGWDTIKPGPHGPAYSKNGGLPGYRAFAGHMPRDIDWAFCATDRSGDDGENADTAQAIQAEIEQITRWPDVDYFQR
jgi:N-acyl-D-amino-acid deacylase